MATLGRGRRQLASLLWKASVDDEVDAEFAFHVEMRVRELVARGMDPAAARAAAVQRFGDIGTVMETCRSIGTQRERTMQRTEYFAELVHDVRFSLRQLLKSPAFTSIAVLTLALGVGATTVIFSAVEAVILRPFPFENPDRLVFAATHWSFGDGSVSAGDYADWKRRSTSFSELGAFSFRGMTIANGESPERVTEAGATANIFDLYGVRPQLGRVFTVAEDQPGRDGVVVLSDGIWRRLFGGDRTVLGRTVSLGGVPHTVIGIMPPGFDPTDSHEDLWTPIAFSPERLAEHDEHYLTVVGRLTSGTTFAAAAHDLDAIAKQLSIELPKTNKVSGVRLRSFTDVIVGDYRSQLLVLLGAVGCVLLIACGNVANLLLARGAARSKELAIRTAIGAGRGRIIRQLLAESVVLSGLATLAGLAFAWVGIHVLLRAAPSTIPRLAATHIDAGVLVFALGVAALSSMIFGLVPAVRAANGDVQQTLREGGRTAAASARDRVRSILVAGEVGIALTLLVGAGLLIRSAIFLSHVDPGFDARGVLSARVALRPAAYRTGVDEAEQTFMRIIGELRAQPGVQSAALSSQVPVGPGGNSNGLIPEGRPRDIANAINSQIRLVTPGYLATMRIPLISGRDVTESDVRGGLRVMVVSASLAKAAWPNENPIGKRVLCCEGSDTDPRWKTVVGVAADVRSGGPTHNVGPEFYMPLVQAPPEAWDWINRTMTLVARSASADATTLAPAMRAAVRAVDSSLPVYDIASMEDRLGQSIAESRFHLMLLAILGGVGLLLAAAGIYSVIAYFVTLRAHEIGVRMALGATSADVLRLMTMQGLRPVAAGALIGGVAATWATRLLRGSLYGVQATDPITFAAVTAGLLLVALCAILIPARRATSVDPTTVLHG